MQGLLVQNEDLINCNWREMFSVIVAKKKICLVIYFVIAVRRAAIGKEFNFLHTHFLRCALVRLHFLKASKTIFFAAVCSKLGALLRRKGFVMAPEKMRLQQRMIQ
jgi:hypothetical protein